MTPEQTQQEEERKKLYDLADEFISLANAMAQKDDTGMVGVALRFAAARYSAFEASTMSTDLSADKAKLIDAFTDDYRKMLHENMEVYIEYLAKHQE